LRKAASRKCQALYFLWQTRHANLTR
jgi:hypothetical protein